MTDNNTIKDFDVSLTNRDIDIETQSSIYNSEIPQNEGVFDYETYSQEEEEQSPKRSKQEISDEMNLDKQSSALLAAVRKIDETIAKRKLTLDRLKNIPIEKLVENISNQDYSFKIHTNFPPAIITKRSEDTKNLFKNVATLVNDYIKTGYEMEIEMNEIDGQNAELVFLTNTAMIIARYEGTEKQIYIDQLNKIKIDLTILRRTNMEKTTSELKAKNTEKDSFQLLAYPVPLSGYLPRDKSDKKDREKKKNNKKIIDLVNEEKLNMPINTSISTTLLKKQDNNINNISNNNNNDSNNNESNSNNNNLNNGNNNQNTNTNINNDADYSNRSVNSRAKNGANKQGPLLPQQAFISSPQEARSMGNRRKKSPLRRHSHEGHNHNHNNNSIYNNSFQNQFQTGTRFQQQQQLSPPFPLYNPIPYHNPPQGYQPGHWGYNP